MKGRVEICCRHWTIMGTGTQGRSGDDGVAETCTPVN